MPCEMCKHCNPGEFTTHCKACLSNNRAGFEAKEDDGE